jgi:hypothetical protein
MSCDFWSLDEPRLWSLGPPPNHLEERGGEWGDNRSNAVGTPASGTSAATPLGSASRGAYPNLDDRRISPLVAVLDHVYVAGLRWPLGWNGHGRVFLWPATGRTCLRGRQDNRASSHGWASHEPRAHCSLASPVVLGTLFSAAAWTERRESRQGRSRQAQG